MTTLGKLQKKINRTKSTATIITTMKNISFVNITHYNRRVKAARDYFIAIEKGLQILLKTSPDILSSLEKQSHRLNGHNLGAVVIGSEKGLCGEFNEKLKRFFLEEMADFSEVDTIAIGYKMSSRLKSYEAQGFDFPRSSDEIGEVIRNLLISIEKWLKTERIKEVRFYYNRKEGGMSYQPTCEPIFPLNIEWLKGLKEKEWTSSSLPIIKMDPHELFYELTQECLYISIYRAFIESLASENAGRLSSMQIAEDNIEEELTKLRTTYQRKRQTQIDEELFDIVSGFEGLHKKQGL